MKKYKFDINRRPDIEAGKVKVVTADGYEATIIKWDAPLENYSIVVMFNNGSVCNYSAEGECIGNRYCDIFIQTDEPDYTGFEQAVYDVLNPNHFYLSEDTVKHAAKKLLEAARKEIQMPSSDADVLEALRTLNLRIIDIAESKPKKEKQYWEQAWRLTNNAINSIEEKVVLNC